MTPMSLVNRRNSSLKPKSSASDARILENDKNKLPPLFRRFQLIFVGAAILLAFNLVPRKGSTFSPGVRASTTYKVIRQEISKDASLVLQLAKFTESNGLYAVGPHHVKLEISSDHCKMPRFFMRLAGDGLVHVGLKDQNKRSWTGSFSVPTNGTYYVDARWYGCEQSEDVLWTSLPEPVEMKVVGAKRQTDTNTSLFTEGSSWVAKRLVNSGVDLSSPYVWKHPTIPAQPENIIETEDSVVLKEGTVRQPNGFHRFTELGNYELLCFMGSQMMADIRKEFLELRTTLFPGQRPFKFHYYNISHFSRPARDWKPPPGNPQEDPNLKVRKCKHILLSVDELADHLSQDEYREQISTFVHHLTKLIDDDTFPIRIFTVNEPPMKASNCHSPTLRRTTDHPCNDVLKDLFRPENNLFPKRVHLLDNTDLSLPQFDENRKDILSVIALRIYVLVGKQVRDWREMGQAGKPDGLHRNGTVIPNFQLVPYPWPDS